jgi:hypothetical protein
VSDVEGRMNFDVCCDVMGQIVVQVAGYWDALGLVECTSQKLLVTYCPGDGHITGRNNFC